MKNLVMILLAPLALAATACSTGTIDSSQVTASAVHEEYSVTYSADSNQMSLWAQFRVGDSTGTTVHLSSPAQLKVNNQGVSSTDFLGTYYSKTFASGFLSSSQVVYTDSTGAAHAYMANLSAINYTAPTTPVTTSTNLVIPLQGTALSSNETVSATITQTNQGPNNSQNYVNIYGHYDSSMNRVVFYNTDLQTLQAGAATISVSRINSTGAGNGYMQTVYAASSHTLQVTK
jgi:hypothetical protein